MAATLVLGSVGKSTSRKKWTLDQLKLSISFSLNLIASLYPLITKNTTLSKGRHHLPQARCNMQRGFSRSRINVITLAYLAYIWQMLAYIWHIFCGYIRHIFCGYIWHIFWQMLAYIMVVTGILGGCHFVR